MAGSPKEEFTEIELRVHHDIGVLIHEPDETESMVLDSQLLSYDGKPFSSDQISRLAKAIVDIQGTEAEAKAIYHDFSELLYLTDKRIKSEAKYTEMYAGLLAHKGTNGLVGHLTALFVDAVRYVESGEISNVRPLNKRLSAIITETHGVRFEEIVSAPSLLDKLCCRTPAVFYQAASAESAGKGASLASRDSQSFGDSDQKTPRPYSPPELI